jgi:SAM-dependent methyltransferase
MTATVRRIGECRLCCSQDLDRHIDFGEVALGNNLQPTAEEARAAEAYRLDLMRCRVCAHFQLGHAVAPELLYATNYTYLSGIGSSFVKHFETYSRWAEEQCELPSEALIVDVGSNDGTCLKAFRDRGYRVCGVDPASLAARIANDNGVETINAFFDDDVVREIIDRHGHADFITSHNVLAHVDDLGAVFRNIHALLKEGGHFAFEVGYFREVLQSGCFDTIYHEHLDYHHAAPLVRHLTGLGFDVIDLGVNSVQGGSVRLLLKKTGAGKISRQAEAFLAEERASVVNDDNFIGQWRQTIQANMAAFRDMLRARVDGGAVIAGYGAPTKAVLLMKMAEIGADEISFVVEDNGYKVGRFLPGSAVPIRPTQELTSSPPQVIVIFAWNFADDIIEKLRGRFGTPVEIITPLPRLRTISL